MYVATTSWNSSKGLARLLLWKNSTGYFPVILILEISVCHPSAESFDKGNITLKMFRDKPHFKFYKNIYQMDILFFKKFPAKHFFSLNSLRGYMICRICFC